MTLHLWLHHPFLVWPECLIHPGESVSKERAGSPEIVSSWWMVPVIWSSPSEERAKFLACRLCDYWWKQWSLLKELWQLMYCSWEIHGFKSRLCYFGTFLFSKQWLWGQSLNLSPYPLHYRIGLVNPTFNVRGRAAIFEYEAISTISSL